MQFRNAWNTLFGKVKQITRVSAWREIGNFNASFVPFGDNIYANDIVRSCVRTLAEHTSKAGVKCIRRTPDGKVEANKSLQRLIQYRPNMYMNGKAFLYKVRTLYEINNTVFIFIDRDVIGRVQGLYPVPTAAAEAVDYNGNLYIRFHFSSGRVLTASWEDLAVLRKDYNRSDIFGDSNSALLPTLELLNVLNQGQANAVKSTANLRGILKSLKAALDPADIKKQQEQFTKDYLNTSNEGGIASLDASQEFIPITMQPVTANYKQFEEQRNNIYRYFGVSEEVVTSKAAGDEWEAFYEAKLEPFLVDLSLELTNKVFTKHERECGNELIFEANRLAYASTATKLAMVQLVDRGAISLNEYRETLNLAPVEGGDIRVIRREYTELSQLGKEEGGTANAD